MEYSIFLQNIGGSDNHTQLTLLATNCNGANFFDTCGIRGCRYGNLSYRQLRLVLCLLLICFSVSLQMLTQSMSTEQQVNWLSLYVQWLKIRVFEYFN